MSSDDFSRHKELELVQIKSSETATSQMKNATKSFTNPFEDDYKEKLFCLASGKPAPQNFREVLLQSRERRQEAMEDFKTTNTKY